MSLALMATSPSSDTANAVHERRHRAEGVTLPHRQLSKPLQQERLGLLILIATSRTSDEDYLARILVTGFHNEIGNQTHLSTTRMKTEVGLDGNYGNWTNVYPQTIHELRIPLLGLINLSDEIGQF